MKILELFSGTESFSKIAREHGHETFTIDNDPQFNPDLCKDILEVEAKDIPFHPDVIWASPPCTTFSVAAIYRYWDDGYPKSWKTFIGLALVQKTIELIKELKPKFFVIENPRGMLRKQKLMEEFKRDTVTYCKYGFHYQKATDLWNNIETWKPRAMCSPGDPCHVRAPRGSQKGVQGLKGRKLAHPDWNYNVSRAAKERGKIPGQLCEEILEAIENVKENP